MNLYMKHPPKSCNHRVSFFVAAGSKYHAPAMPVIGNFGFKSGRDINKFDGIDCRTGRNGVPIVLNSVLAFSELELINQMDMGSHTMFVGKVINGDICLIRTL